MYSQVLCDVHVVDRLYVIMLVHPLNPYQLVSKTLYTVILKAHLCGIQKL